MAYTPWLTAHGEAAPMILRVATIVPLSPADDSVDTNTVVLEGAGTIMSFGPSPHIVLKRVKFIPLVLREGSERAPGAAITLVNSASLNLLSGQQRSINGVSYGMYVCDGMNRWDEIYFVQQGAYSDASVLNDQLAELERRLALVEKSRA
jgi:hypothetical protein